MRKAVKALVIDDDDLALRSISSVFRAEGWTVHESKPIADPFGLLLSSDWDVVIYEAAPQLGYGFDLARVLAAHSRDCKVVVTSRQPSASDALEAITFGAYEYLPKPLDEEIIRLLSNKLYQRFNAASDFVVSRQSKKYSRSDRFLVGKSFPFIEVMKQVGRIAATSLPVLLTGESGTGKEVVATALYQSSNRADGPFVALNCGAIPGELIESELFGHQRGAFTGAERDRQGLWEEAAGGTIFLDEITETSPAFQVKLLRAIQHGEVRRIGSNQMQQLDVRVIASSNRDVEKEVQAGRFRQDLFYRLNAVSIRLPALRERREDIPLLIETFVRALGRPELKFSLEAIEMLRRYPWPGNVRELEHAVTRSVAMCDGVVLAPDLPERVRNWQSITKAPNVDLLGAESQDWPPLKDVEGDYVARALAHSNWNKQATARLLNIDRKTLERKIKRYSIVRDMAREPTTQNRQAA